MSRLLAADKKSVSNESPMTSSRRNSNGSSSPTSISVHSASSGNAGFGTESGNVPEYSDGTWDFWGRIVNDWDEQRKKNGKQIKVGVKFFLLYFTLYFTLLTSSKIYVGRSQMKSRKHGA